MTLRFSKHAFDFGPNMRHLTVRVALMLQVISIHGPNDLTNSSA
jgi:hypothetical protein